MAREGDVPSSLARKVRVDGVEVFCPECAEAEFGDDAR
jgi:hypothetical protein